jgi:hypothetical protein
MKSIANFLEVIKINSSKVDNDLKNLSDSNKKFMKISNSHEDIKDSTQEAYNFKEIKKNYEKLREQGTKSGLGYFNHTQSSVKR